MAQAQVKIKELLPRGYGNTLAERTGCHPEYAREVVRQENTRSYIWPEVLKLAKEYQVELRDRQRELEKLKSVA